MKQDKIESLISYFENDRLPKAHHREEQHYIALMRDLKAAGNLELIPDNQFTDDLETKLMKGGDKKMANLSQMLTKASIAWGLVGVLLLVVISSNMGMPQTPFSALNRSFETVVKDESTQSISNPYAIDAIGGGIAGNVGVSEKMMANPADMTTMTYPAPMPPVIYPSQDDYTNPDRSIVRSGSLSVKVKEVSPAVTEATQYVESIGGYVTNSSLNKTEKGYEAYLTVVVPQREFTTAIQYFKRQAKEIVNEYLSAYDQTGVVTEVEDRSEEIKAQLAEYEALLANTQNNLERIKLQNQINNLKQQLKDLERQQKSLEGQEQMSTISLTMIEDRFTLPLVNQLGLESTIQQASRALLKTVLWLVVLLIWAVIFAPVWLPIWLVSRWWKRKQK